MDRHYWDGMLRFAHLISLIALQGNYTIEYDPEHLLKVRPGAGPILQEWGTDIQDQCLGARVPFFFKQCGSMQKTQAGRILESRTWGEMPVSLSLAKA